MSAFGIIGQALAAGLSGAGEGAVQGTQNEIKEAARLKEIQATSDAEQMKQQAILKYSNDLANAPATRLGGYMQTASNEQIPVQPSPVTQLDPSSAKAAGLTTDGLSGNIDDLRAKYTAMLNAPNITDDQKQNINGILEQIDKQASAAQNQAQTDVSGKTRTRTAQESLQRAAEIALAKGDTQAYSAAKAAIGDKYMKIGEGDSLIDLTTGKPVMSNNSKADRTLQLEREKEAGLDRRSALDRDNRLLVSQLADKDPQFVKVLKQAYTPGTPEYDEALRQYVNKESGINAAGGGGRSVVYNGRIIASGNEIAAALHNITALPVGSNTGFLGYGKSEGSGLLSSGIAGLKNELNPDEIKTYNTMWTGVSRNLGTLETSGLATTGNLVASIDKLQFVPGDNGYNALRKLAEVRQVVDAALEPKLQDPAVPPQQKQFIQGVLDKVKEAVPYTHADLTAFNNAQKKTPDLTFADFAKNTVQSMPGVSAPSSHVTSGNSVLTYDPKTGTFH